jgi:hypothetical protein
MDEIPLDKEIIDNKKNSINMRKYTPNEKLGKMGNDIFRMKFIVDNIKIIIKNNPIKKDIFALENL